MLGSSWVISRISPCCEEDAKFWDEDAINRVSTTKFRVSTTLDWGKYAWELKLFNPASARRENLNGSNSLRRKKGTQARRKPT